VLTGDDFRKGTEFSDGCFPCSWHIDLHAPDTRFDKGHTGDEFISKATSGTNYTYKSPYWAPYRTLYSRNLSNLFMAGRDISVSHEALGPVRVMRTCGMWGNCRQSRLDQCAPSDHSAGRLRTPSPTAQSADESAGLQPA